MNNDNQHEIVDLKRVVQINNLLIIVFLGFILNLTVVVSNESRMPIHIQENEEVIFNEATHSTFTNWSEVNYPFLSDILKVGNSNFWLMFSVGDVFIFAGLFLVIVIFGKQIINSKQESKNGVIKSNK